MHYYVDGYNLMFRILYGEDEISAQRQQLIDDLNRKIQLLELEVTIVFDAQYQYGDSSRSHFQNLEILFTAHGETADELILEEIKAEPNPHQVTVVTSDKKLAWFARRCAAKTESVEQFVEWVNTRFKNKIRKQKLGIPQAKNKEVKITLTKPKRPIPGITPEESFDFYLTQFQESFEKIRATEVKKPSSLSQQQKKGIKKPPRAPKKESGVSDMDRWKKLFEQRLESGNNIDE